MINQQSAVYVITNWNYTVLYIGATKNLAARIETHKNGGVDGFGKKYQCRYLLHVELYDTWAAAIHRERQLKKWKRAWKNRLITKNNPEWRDLSWDI